MASTRSSRATPPPPPPPPPRGGGRGLRCSDSDKAGRQITCDSSQSLVDPGHEAEIVAHLPPGFPAIGFAPCDERAVLRPDDLPRRQHVDLALRQRQVF